MRPSHASRPDHPLPPHRPPSRIRRRAGQAATDYLLVVALVAVVLSVGQDGPIAQLARALNDHYQRFSWSIAQP